MNVCLEGNPAGSEVLGEGRRAGADALGSAIARIESAVADSCAGQAEWPARVAAGFEAAVEFLIANPHAAQALVADRRSGFPEDDALFDEMIARIAGMLGRDAPASDRLPPSSAGPLVSVIAGVLGCHVRAGTIDSLGEGDPDLVFLALLPYLGFAEASRWVAELGVARAPQV